MRKTDETIRKSFEDILLDPEVPDEVKVRIVVDSIDAGIFEEGSVVNLRINDELTTFHITKDGIKTDYDILSLKKIYKEISSEIEQLAKKITKRGEKVIETGISAVQNVLETFVGMSQKEFFNASRILEGKNVERAAEIALEDDKVMRLVYKYYFDPRFTRFTTVAGYTLEEIAKTEPERINLKVIEKLINTYTKPDAAHKSRVHLFILRNSLGKILGIAAKKRKEVLDFVAGLPEDDDSSKIDITLETWNFLAKYKPENLDVQQVEKYINIKSEFAREKVARIFSNLSRTMPEVVDPGIFKKFAKDNYGAVRNVAATGLANLSFHKNGALKLIEKMEKGRDEKIKKVAKKAKKIIEKRKDKIKK